MGENMCDDQRHHGTRAVSHLFVWRARLCECIIINIKLCLSCYKRTAMMTEKIIFSREFQTRIACQSAVVVFVVAVPSCLFWSIFWQVRKWLESNIDKLKRMRSNRRDGKEECVTELIHVVAARDKRIHFARQRLLRCTLHAHMHISTWHCKGLERWCYIAIAKSR